VRVVFPGVGLLFTNRDGRVQFKFEPALVAHVAERFHVPKVIACSFGLFTFLLLTKSENGQKEKREVLFMALLAKKMFISPVFTFQLQELVPHSASSVRCMLIS
jgi:hypothetical protein